MGTFEQDNNIGAFSALNVESVYQMFRDGDLSAAQALHAIAQDAGVIERTPAQIALGDLVRKVEAGELPAAALVAAIDEEAEATRPDVTVSVTRSAGDDRAVLVFIDTTFEPDGSDGGPGLRVLVNDDEAYVGVSYDYLAFHEAKAKKMTVGLDEIAYTGKESR